MIHRLPVTLHILLGAAMCTAGGCVASSRPNVPLTRAEVKPVSPANTPVLEPSSHGSEAARKTVNSSKTSTSDRSTVAPAQFSTPDAGSETAESQTANLISLWGDEFIETSVDAASPFDGSGNIRQISFATEGATFDPDVSRGGDWLVFSSTRHRQTADVYLKSTRGTTVTQLTSDPGHDIMPAFDPATARVAFASDRSGSWDLYLMPVKGGPPAQLTNDPEPELHPTWSPDGRRLAFCRFGARTNRWEIWVIDIDQPGAPSFLTFGVFPQWSPDVTSSKILFQRARERGSRFHSVWTIDLDQATGEAHRPTEILSAGNAALINPAWSPDGRRVVFATVVEPEDEMNRRPAQSDIWVVNLDGSRRVNLTNGDFANYQPVWATNDSIYFVSNRSSVDNIWSVSAGLASAGSPLRTGGQVVTAPTDRPDEGGQP